jgi:hypothetical protein
MVVGAFLTSFSFSLLYVEGRMRTDAARAGTDDDSRELVESFRIGTAVTTVAGKTAVGVTTS